MVDPAGYNAKTRAIQATSLEPKVADDIMPFVHYLMKII